MEFHGKFIGNVLGVFTINRMVPWNFRGISASAICMYTSSTAQGGGGSFENMKPIGEVGCCESRMTEQIH